MLGPIETVFSSPATQAQTPKEQINSNLGSSIFGGDIISANKKTTPLESVTSTAQEILNKALNKGKTGPSGN